MKKIHYLFICLFMPFLIFAQAPGSFVKDYGSQTNKGTAILLNMTAFRLFELPNGEIVVPGLIGDENEGFGGYAKLTTSGQIDPEFGNNGYKKSTQKGFPLDIIPVDDQHFLSNIFYQDSNRMEIQQRLYNTFELDSTFGENGIASYKFSEIGFTLDLEVVDTKILVLFRGDETIKLIRLNPDGSFNNTFGNGGVINLAITEDHDFHQLIIRDEYIYIGGYEDSSLLGDGVGMLRLNLSDGSLDTNFGDNGHIFHPLEDFNITELEPITFLPNGKINILGSNQVISNGQFKILQLLPDGSIDPEYGVNGVSTTTIGGKYFNATSLYAPEFGNRIISGGSNTGAFLCRLNDDGSLDIAFGEAGIVSLVFDSESYYNNILYSTSLDIYSTIGYTDDFSFVSKIHAGIFISTERIQTSVKVNIHPNPIAQNFSISFEQKESQDIDIQLVNLDGKTIQSLYQGFSPKGTFEQEFQVSSSVPTGNYMVLVRSKDAILRKLIHLVRK